MAFILSIETATAAGSVALHKDGVLLASFFLLDQNSHSRTIAPAIDFALAQAQITYKDLAAIVVSSGPGSYTGLRIGASLAKGLCFSLNIPLIALPTLKIMAVGLQPFNTAGFDFMPMMDARRMEVYTAIYSFQNSLVEEIPAQPLILTEEERVVTFIGNRKLIIAGDGAEKATQLKLNPNIFFVPNYHPSAEWMGALGFEAFNQQQFADLAYFEPFYMKEP
ncbi:MAG: tRNA (adenosine(37)-N6)-threonylcarbamoyltransferase complex dimerization subunit type 1 TsaB, partial [Chitinophagia bacterium]|nr:tRNA (adenosine(37)-N6)-threonylcarbamoyltransferase complex dimerization subunit type 1 TsaB [Chitinophagia bacterium]